MGMLSNVKLWYKFDELYILELGHFAILPIRISNPDLVNLR